MSTTYPLATLAASISASGITAPAYADILASLQASFRSIYGTDSYIDPDSQDGQLLAIFAKAIHDCNQSTIAAYNSFSPATAQGAGLSSVVKINHIARSVPSHSQVVVTLVGQAGTIITDGIVGDLTGNRWLLPTSVTIPLGGSITVTATAEEAGAIAAVIGSITKIITPTAGWQTVTNPSSATTGAAVETDYALRIRQQTSTALRSLTVLEGLVGALQNLVGVLYASAYENDTGVTDSNGLPPHSIACVVIGGLSDQIAQTIYDKKSPGCATYGTTVVSVVDSFGLPKTINYFVPLNVPCKVRVTIQAGATYTSVIGDQIKQALVEAINLLEVGHDVETTRLYLPALLLGTENSNSYILQLVESAIIPAAFGTGVLTIAFNERATCQLSDVTLVVV